ncbi:MAG: nucleotidyltransferase [Armatimonadetes bacterium]|nr:nucleotidyltransferase [Armatimonadota bacterium]MDE2207586.1 nucleotidyltransferase [Armatimonadota bacterium]
MNPLAETHVAALADLANAFERLKLKAVVIGGVAVCLVARPRYTRVVDALVMFDTEHVDALLADLEARGFVPRSRGMGNFARQARFVGLTHQRSGMAIDIALGCMHFEAEVIERSTEHLDGELKVRLPTPEDLIILKAIANRHQDRADIQTIAEVHPAIDRSRIRFWVEQYATLLEAPELWSTIEPLLTDPVGAGF